MRKRMLAALLAALFLIPSALALEGMDVSVYQGDVDFAAARSDGIEAVYIRASYGEDGVDQAFRAHYDAARAAGVHFGFYHYLEAATPEEARLEGAHFASLIRGLDYDCRPALDYENFHGLPRQETTDVAAAFLETVEEALGQTPMLYADAYAAAHRFESTLSRYPLWVAQWDVSAPTLAGSPWTDWAGWQYTDQGAVSGVSGRVDRDLFTNAVLLEDQTDYFLYTVRPGDTLWALSLRYDTTVAELVRLNDIQNPDLIYVGQTLKIPGPAPAYETYTVRPGDTLWAISLRYDTTVAELVRLNDIQNPDLIYPGQTLKIPA